MSDIVPVIVRPELIPNEVCKSGFFSALVSSDICLWHVIFNAAAIVAKFEPVLVTRQI
jgi:hypothetical protein